MAYKLSDRALKAIQNRPRRKVQAFLFCLIISVFIWFTRELSKDFTTTLNIPINYVDLPDKLMLYGSNPSTLSVTITSAGFDVFGQSMLGRIGNVNVSLAHIHGPGVTSFDEFFLQAQLASAISNEAEVISFAPKQISLDIAKKSIKKVPVVTSVSATIEDPYFLLGNPISNPDSVEIEGPLPILDSIKQISTAMVEFAAISEAQTQRTRLNLPNEVRSPIQEVQVTIQLDQWTEKKFTVPVHVALTEEEFKMKTFPDSAEITCQVGLSNFDSVVENNFRIEAGNLSLKDLEQEYEVLLNVSEKPSNIRHIVIEPETVEFILIEK